MNGCNSKPVISIIVPIYKTEKYLHCCIDSILAQAFTDIECILIDDGSPDKCPAICDEYAKKDGRVVVIHQENRGVSAARNAGLEAARGEWIGFVDSDDWIEPDMYKSLLDACIVNNSDIAVCNMYIEKMEKTFRRKRTEADSRQCIESCISSRSGPLFMLTLGKNSLVTQFRFDENISYSEDQLFCVQCLTTARNIVVLDEYYYHYNLANPSSAMTTITIMGIDEQYKVVLLIERYLIESNLYAQYKDSIGYAKLCHKYRLVAFSFRILKEQDIETNKYWKDLPLFRKFKFLFFMLISNFIR
jgi:glycosyltransferase involved in cell wall biosynthesis